MRGFRSLFLFKFYALHAGESVQRAAQGAGISGWDSARDVFYVILINPVQGIRCSVTGCRKKLFTADQLNAGTVNGAFGSGEISYSVLRDERKIE